MRKLFLLALMVISAAAAKAQETYNKDSIDKVVYAELQKDTTTDRKDWVNGLIRATDMAVSNKHFGNLDLRDFMMGQFFRNEFPGSHDIKEYVDAFLNHCSEDSLRQQIQGEYTKYVKKYGAVFPGKPAPDFSFFDVKGKVHRLSEMKGQILFIDIWGTWCAPCIEEIPYLKALQAKYGKDKRVKIMSIACDKTDPKWKAFLQKRKDDMTWSQYRVTPEGDKVLDNVYYVYGIPRFMMIDKNGVIIDSDTLRPSMTDYFSKMFEEQLSKF